MQLRKNDQVKVIAGRDKGKTGRILSVHPDTGRVLVEHVNMIKRHTRKNPAKQIAGGIAEREASIAVSNVMILCGKCGAVRIKHRIVEVPGGKSRRQRVCPKCEGALDKK
ncbi:MAG: 50S ribosomal protein L24 [Acidobacteriota bacterium]